jgi:PAS domain S-box-containing protein
MRPASVPIKSRREKADSNPGDARVNFYLLLPLASCIGCAMLAVAVLARDSSRRSSRLGVAVAVCGAWWAGCEVLWSTAHDANSALWLIRASAFGWMLIGPAVLHLFLELTSHPLRLRPWLPAVLYTVPALLAVADLTTDWIHTRPIPTPWGWGWEVGPAFAISVAISAATVLAAVVVAFRHLQHSASPAEERQTRWLFVGLLIPLFVACFTDGLLPILGIQQPRLGAASITLLVASTAWTFQRYGYSVLAPGAFANEILATLSDGVALVRLDGRIHSANQGMGRLLGTHHRALEGRALAELVDAELPEPLRELSERECALLPEGRDPVPTSIRSSLVRDKQQNPIGFVLVARDLREIASLRSRLVTSDRLACVGQLAAGIAHEINNPVTYVRANLGALRSGLDTIGSKLPGPAARELADELDEGRELIEESLDGVDRVIAIVRDVKSFSHAGGSEIEVVEIPPLIESVLRVAAPQMSHGGKVICEIADVPPVRGAAHQLQQVFLNLVINAFQAVSGDESIRVVVAHADGQVVVEIHDEGCGIPPDRIERIFDPFYTTKPVGEGTGLGLSISYQLIQSHHGDLTVDSTPGQGSCFRVILPAAENA